MENLPGAVRSTLNATIDGQTGRTGTKRRRGGIKVWIETLGTIPAVQSSLKSLLNEEKDLRGEHQTLQQAEHHDQQDRHGDHDFDQGKACFAFHSPDPPAVYSQRIRPAAETTTFMPPALFSRRYDPEGTATPRE